MNNNLSAKPSTRAGARAPLSPRRLSDAINRFGEPAEASSAVVSENPVTPWKAGPAERQSWPAKILISDYSVSPESPAGNGQDLGQVTQAQALILVTAEAAFDPSSEVRLQAVYWQVLSYLMLAQMGDSVIYQLTLIRRPPLS